MIERGVRTMHTSVKAFVMRKENGLGRWTVNLMIEEYQICHNYHVCGDPYCKHEIKDQLACIQNYPAFTHSTTLNAFQILVG